MNVSVAQAIIISVALLCTTWLFIHRSEEGRQLRARRRRIRRARGEWFWWLWWWPTS